MFIRETEREDDKIMTYDLRYDIKRLTFNQQTYFYLKYVSLIQKIDIDKEKIGT